MQYALLIYTDETQDTQATPEEMNQVMAAYNAFGEQYKDQITGGEALNPTSSATTVRVRDGKSLTTDGPFAETKEQLGGFYLVKAANLDEAIAIAANIPGAKFGSVEVRPVMEFGEE
ncbi:MAG TPA: YciI family protein [Ktedonobacterales bacterium]